MEIQLEGIGKRFKRQWLYRNISLQILPGQPMAITGPNGSGKSTLLQILSGYLSPSVGSVRYVHDGNSISREEIYKQVSIASPHLELHDQLTLEETIQFHHKVCPIPGFYSVEDCITEMQLSGNSRKQLKSFSSGMRQRVKLYLAIRNSSNILLLDEPAANLDSRGIDWFQSMLAPVKGQNRVVAICSNMRDEELSLCTQRLSLEQYQ